jgi:hypothetical protein
MFIAVATSPAATEKPTSTSRKLNRKMTALVAAVAVIAIVIVALLIPQGAAIIPLDVNYVVGEKMVYQINQEITMLDSAPPFTNAQANVIFNSTCTVEVKDYDGEFYTLNRTYVFTSETKPFGTQNSFVQKISRQGYTINAYGSSSDNGTDNPFLVGILNRTEVHVGDTWTVPVTSVSQSGTNSGNITLTFRGFEDITVKAGTFHVFKVESQSNMTMTFTPQTAHGIQTSTLAISQNGTMYMEANTCRQIKSNVQQVVNAQSTNSADGTQITKYTSLQVSSQELVQDILP